MMVTQPKRRRGRPANYVHDHDGKPVVGLSKMPEPDCRHYATHSKPRKYFHTDFDTALWEFKKWDEAQKGKVEELSIQIEDDETTITSEDPKIIDDWAQIAVPQGELHTGEPGDEPTYIFKGDIVKIPARLVWSEARRLILNNPIEASQKLGIPEIARLRDLEPLKPSMKLTEVADLYYKKRKPICKHELIDSKSFWNQFCKIVGVKTVREVTVDLINKYQDEIYRIQRDVLVRKSSGIFLTVSV